MLTTTVRLVFVVSLAALLAACNLTTEPTRIQVDPRLDELLSQDAGGVADVSPDAPAEEDAAAEPDAASLSGPPFTCTPSCPQGAWCLPSGLCSPLGTSCAQEGALCDPAVVAPTTEFVCEAVFDTSAGLCRRVCAPDNNTCARDQSCTRLFIGSPIFTCNDRCRDDGECNGIDVCDVASLVPACRAACQPFASGQCAEGRRCIPLNTERGICQVEGSAGAGAACEDEEECGEGLLCFNGGGESGMCVPYCDPEASVGGLGACGAGESCLALAQVELGVCFPGCDLFAAQGCAAGLGCYLTATEGAAGVCIARGATARGGACEATAECTGDLQCLGDGNGGATCELFCQPGAEDGPGACPSGETCARLTGTTLGFCR